MKMFDKIMLVIPVTARRPNGRLDRIDIMSSTQVMLSILPT